MSNFLLNKYVAIKKYNCYKRCTIKEIWKHLGREKTWRGAEPWRQRWKYLILKAGIRGHFFLWKWSQKPEIAAEYLGQI